jgi:dethiobiotin synthetase
MLVVCAGTATDVGKTWVGAAVLRHVRGLGVSVSARKPVQSFDSAADTDAAVLADSTGEDVHRVCPAHRWYSVPMAPPMAADALGMPPPLLLDLVEELNWPSPFPTVRWVESVGGVRSPLAEDGDTVDLCEAVDPDLVVLVADAGLGTINAVRVSMAPLGGRPAVVMLNRYDASQDVHRRNRRWLAQRCGLDVVVSVDELATRLGS